MASSSPRRGRASNGESTIYQAEDGTWHGRVSMGLRDDGKADRRHVQGKTRPLVAKKVRNLEKERESGSTRKAGQDWTVKAWLVHWLDNIAEPNLRYKTVVGYRTDVLKHLVPGIGSHRLIRLEPEHIEKFYKKMQAEGASPGTAHHVHRTLSSALGEAVRRGHVSKNVATIARAPRVPDVEIDPVSLTDTRRLLDVANAQDRNGARWVVALALGLRQGEALGLRWDDIDFEQNTLRPRKKLQRRSWKHGCTPVASCGGRRGADCPSRHGGGLVLDELKSKAGRRVWAMPAPLNQHLLRHREAQEAECCQAGSTWLGQGFVFASPTGTPIDPRADSRRWHELLAEAGVPEARLHDARHTAATSLLVLGVNQRAVMGLMGWSSSTMAERYQHLVPEVLRDVAAQVGELLWAPSD